MRKSRKQAIDDEVYHQYTVAVDRQRDEDYYDALMGRAEQFESGNAEVQSEDFPDTQRNRDAVAAELRKIAVPFKR